MINNPIEIHINIRTINHINAMINLLYFVNTSLIKYYLNKTPFKIPYNIYSMLNKKIKKTK